MDHLLRISPEFRLTLRNGALDYHTRTTPGAPRTIPEVDVIDLGIADRGYLDFHPALRTGLHNRVPLVEILEALG
jgi:hypothetical protein